MPLVVTALAVLGGLLLTPPGAAPGHVLAPAAEGPVRALLGLDQGPLGKVTLQVKIDQSRILVTGLDRSGKRVLAITLVHPDGADPGAPTFGGVAVVSQPGPVDKGAMKRLMGRLKKATAVVPWTKIAPASRPDESAEADRIHDVLDRVRYEHAIGRSKRARELLSSLPSSMAPGAVFEACVAYRRLGDEAAVKRLLAGLGQLDAADSLAALIVGAKPYDVAASLGARDGDAACRFAHVPELLSALGDSEAALNLAHEIRTRARPCRRAWESEIHRLLEARRFEDALDVNREAAALFGDDDRLTSLMASVMTANGKYREAAPLLEGLARKHPDQEGVVRVLLSALLRDPAYRKEKEAQLAREHQSNPDDDLTTFLLGVIRHYGDDFEGSNALLAPLEATMGHQQRLHIYRSMNDFNLGHRAAALGRLDEAAKRPVPDPDVFYCRAEILRDTDRKQALSDLERYRANVDGGYLANPDKEARVDRMVASLRACLADGRPVCEGDWEHPRRKIEPAISVAAPEDGGPSWPLLGLAALALVAGVFWAVRRRAVRSE